MPGTLSVVPKTAAASVRLLLVTRESAVLSLLWSIGEKRKWHLESATNGWGAMERVQSGVTPDLLILDLPRADGDGLHFLRWLRRLRPELPILVLCHEDDSLTEQEAIRLGARDCLVWPVADSHPAEGHRPVAVDLGPRRRTWNQQRRCGAGGWERAVRRRKSYHAQVACANRITS